MSRPLLSTILLALLGCRAEGHSDMLARMDPTVDPGLAAFAYGDLGALSRAGLDRLTSPWKLVAIGLLQRSERERGHRLSLDSLPALLRQYGFLDPKRIRNWVGPAPESSSPAIGFVTGRVPLGVPGASVEGLVLGCAACHTGMLYDGSGRPTGEAWLGLPNTSLQLDAFGDDVFAALRESLRDPDALLARVRTEFPETGVREGWTLRHLVIPRTRKRLDAFAARRGALLPFRSGPPGTTNGLAALKYFLRPDQDRIDWSQEHGYAAIPDLSSRHLRSAMFVDAVYVPRGGTRGVARSGAGDANAPYLDSLAPIVAFIAVPAMGVPADRAVREIPTARAMLSWMTTYRTPPFPGPIDDALAAEGAALFTQNCSTCHGVYASSGPRPRLIERYPNRLISLERIGSDSMRASLADSLTGAVIRRSAFGPYLEAASGMSYVPPILNGIWATAPYLHDASVPTVWDMLTPDGRPSRFPVGGHRLDFAKLGIALEPDGDGVRRNPADHVPWARSVLYDTREPGQANSGHRFPSQGLTDADKRRIIEYLKTL